MKFKLNPILVFSTNFRKKIIFSVISLVVRGMDRKSVLQWLYYLDGATYDNHNNLISYQKHCVKHRNKRETSRFSCLDVASIVI